MSFLQHFNFEHGNKSSSATVTATTSIPSELPSPSAIELDNMKLGPDALYTGPITRPPSIHKHRSMSVTSDLPTRQVSDAFEHEHTDIEMSRPSTPIASDDATGIAQTFWNPVMNKWRVLSYCIMLFCNGANDSAPGALLPYMEAHYHIGYAIVSLIFISNAVGFIAAAFFVHALDHKLGRARVLMLCEALCILAYVVMAVAPPFPLFALAFVPTGFAMATMLAPGNVFIANMKGATGILGLAQGSYGIGGIVGPIAASALASHGILFSRYYAMLIGFRFLSLVVQGWTFRDYESDNQAPQELLSPAERTISQQQRHDAGAVEASRLSGLTGALRNRVTIGGALFIFAYQGAEVSISGWVISFLLNYRTTSPEKVGYVTTYFWAGITVGRLFLSPFASSIGEKLFVYILTLLAIGFQLLVWLLPNLAGNFVAIALVGLVLGPIYPAATTVFARLLPRQVQSTALAFVGSAGSSGGAIAPFLTGLLSQASGTWVLHPVAVGLFAAMLGVWFLMPKMDKRRE